MVVKQSFLKQGEELRLKRSARDRVLNNHWKVEMTQISTKEWMNKTRACVWEYYSAIKRNEIVTCYMFDESKNIMLSERSQAQQFTCSMIPFIWNIQNRQIHGDKNPISASKGTSGGGMESDHFCGPGCCSGSWESLDIGKRWRWRDIGRHQPLLNCLL